ncbi:chromosome segregation protein SMC [Alteromonas pelagimontana]|uniref:Chromosome partition protein Smc n=1 Tax=Alteromonas pelagimontana TaxID=1858656 RepID=A0A6M4MHL6_9ALTE|nr:chromosome segregation protein SMC [Alteromonas pelagimontana]QJR82497.1 chromosome segregation protein SMC [Alteromonas pelagimontana]
MRLKKIKLAGFKSFVDPTTIPFPGKMTAILGPNGCGKSNVIDAVRWVLGESSAKNLRGDAMTDVIFNGSSARKPVGQCSVELTFDNSSGRIGGEYAKYNELAVKRLVTRDAQSHYFLNGVKCRRRDVTDLFLGTGLGPRSYAIIEQGMISRLIESKPQELRIFIEEAAGISKYKERRRETESRIRHTHENLERLEDVRNELGKQLEKLQRQAAAAQRYKTLKSTERTLKAELAAIRWLKHNEHISRLESDERQQQSEVDALVAQQRGDEAGMMVYTEQAASHKAQLDDLQQQLFGISTSITRIEQNMLHSQQRNNQITEELDELNNKRNVLASAMSEAKTAKAMAQQQLEELIPRQEIIDETLFQAQDNRDQAEQALRSFNAKSRDQESGYNDVKQKAQNCHGQIQSAMNMQLRTSQRISELKQELRELAQDDLTVKLAQLQNEIELARGKLGSCEVSYSQRAENHNAATEKSRQTQGLLTQAQGDVQQMESRIAALETLQQSAVAENGELPDSVQALWQSLVVEPGREKLVEQTLKYLQHPVVANELSLQDLIDDLDNVPAGIPIYTSDSFTTTKIPGTLAQSLNQTRVPNIFNSIYIASDVATAMERVSSLDNNESVVLESGGWIGRDWLVYGEASEETGALQRAAQLSSLYEHLQQLQAKLEETSELADNFRANERETLIQLDEAKAKRNETSNALQQLQNQYGVAKLQKEQSENRAQRTAEDLAKHEEMLEMEQQQIEALSAQLEVLEESIVDHETQMEESQQQREKLEHQAIEFRRSVDQYTAEKHQLALSIQQQQSQQSLYEQQVTRNQTQLAEYENRERLLREERDSIATPLETQKEQLQTLLLQREDTEELRLTEQQKLQNAEALLQEAQQGQKGLQEQIQQRQKIIDSVKIEIEGYRVRANSVLEQLQETGQSLKPILENLANNADENEWQKELEKTTAAVARLGAVNLAAVEEYEVQAERKNHLDMQHEDLVTAMDTLQTAIRKIDKETRTRFSQTFEDVNEGLKTLFPKVFGGGAAYLALTDDDLLETGVTIMARPPGKKNSTIHLLSGGEKALTALSLVFAIFRLNPAPFCLLDEVDAPLDDANVGRFCNLVSEMSSSVQFIYITHNKIAMEMATHLTGVTMAEPGVSRMVAVDVDEAMAFVEA